MREAKNGTKEEIVDIAWSLRVLTAVFERVSFFSSLLLAVPPRGCSPREECRRGSPGPQQRECSPCCAVRRGGRRGQEVCDQLVRPQVSEICDLFFFWLFPLRYFRHVKMTGDTTAVDCDQLRVLYGDRVGWRRRGRMRN